MSYTYTSPREKLDDLCRNVLVSAHLAKSGRLTPEFADALASRVKAASSAMVEPGDRELLRYTAAQLGAVSTRIKAGEARTRAKASNGNGSRSVPRPAPDYLRLSREADAEQMSLGGPFDRTEFEDVERRRSETQNAMLAAKQRKLEEQRRAQVAQDEPETPWWR
jgi:hypothetical protein